VTGGPSPEFISRLAAKLRFSKDIFDDTTNPHNKRMQWMNQIRMLIAVGNKFEAFSKEELLLPLENLLWALHSLEGGFVEPPLAPRKVKHRRRSLTAATLRAHAAAASKALLRVGISPSQADTAVADHLAKLGYRRSSIRGDRRITSSTIKGWRKEAREGDADEPMRIMYELLLRSPSPPLARVVSFLAERIDWQQAEMRIVLGSVATELARSAHSAHEVGAWLEYDGIIESILHFWPPGSSQSIS
jgi:hypothetical protein